MVFHGEGFLLPHGQLPGRDPLTPLIGHVRDVKPRALVAAADKLIRSTGGSPVAGRLRPEQGVVERRWLGE